MTVMYRTESYSGSGVRDAIEVVRFEMFELGNTDILETLAKGLLKDSAIASTLSAMSYELETKGYINDFSEGEQTRFCEELLESVSETSGAKVRYALWLADAEGVKRYCQGENSHLDSYNTTQGVLLSDLDSDGKLYGFAEMPVAFHS